MNKKRTTGQLGKIFFCNHILFVFGLFTFVVRARKPRERRSVIRYVLFLMMHLFVNFDFLQVHHICLGGDKTIHPR